MERNTMQTVNSNVL